MKPEAVRSLVVDASAFVSMLARPREVEPIVRALRDEDSVLHVPEMCDLEVIATLLKRMRGGSIVDREAVSLFSDYVSLPVRRYGHFPFLPRVLALRSNFSPYDSVYVALAEELEAELVTADLRLARGVVAHTDVSVIAA